MKVKVTTLDEAYELKKASGQIPVKGHMAGGHFVAPHFRKKTWMVHFADGSKARVSAISKWAALQEAKQYSNLVPVKVDEEKE